MNDWDAFRVLLSVVERGSFSAGARALGISQPTAGRKVAALEEALGARLLVRRARGVVLTPAGEEVIVEARRMAEGAAAAARRASGESAPSVVRISTSEGIGAAWLPKRLLAIARANPGLRLELVIDNAPVDLSRRQADVAVRLFRPREPDIVARKIASLGFGLFAAPSYLSARGRPKRAADLAKHDVIGFSDSGSIAGYERWLRKIVPRDRFVVRSSSILAQHEAARSGFGIVVGALAILGPDRALERVLPRAKPPSMDIWVAAHADVRRNAGVARVFDALVDLFTREAASLAG
ncbi:MAG: LysR family transcriptional regulator [Polyangiales bacterium]